MADLLATTADLAALLQTTIDEAAATVCLEAATAVVQEAAGQRIVQIQDDTASILGTLDSWLQLPQQPVTEVTAVTIDDETIDDWKRHGSRLWRANGWQTYLYEPSTIGFTYTHGYPPGSQELELARATTLMLARAVYVNPTGLRSEGIGDYTYTFAYEQAIGYMENSPNVKQALRRQYGIRAGLVRIGGS